MRSGRGNRRRRAEALVEWDVNPNPLRAEYFRAPFEIRDGRIALPEHPGLGWM